ncbi:hypothetical protein [Ferruginibacter sp. HRS2-29]|uniref:hypothetical protein n=1 Tax=Ferruginibacter sp. HRS2-29 TaxID=2487334 RepID=UPI0020CCEB4F|nr:hypothetical protein [Ferruginibacter sp. HRS2-29]MCP9751909.1 hypothetical protein [Ferruginibacter sp. HRS2-29]
MKEGNEKSSHILNASSNLLGICFILITSFRVLHLSGTTFFDELSVLALVLFMASCILSFLSIRSKTNKSILYENIADGIFLAGLIVLFITTILYSFNVI